MKEIIAVTLCISFIICSIMFCWEATRRPADEKVKINQSIIQSPVEETLAMKIQSCINGGGMPNYSSGQFVDCKKSK